MVHRLASCMVGMTLNLGVSQLFLGILVMFSRLHSYFHYIVLIKVDEVFPRSIRGASECRSYHF